MNHTGRPGHMLFRSLEMLPSNQKNEKSNPIPLLYLLPMALHTTGISTFDIPL